MDLTKAKGDFCWNTQQEAEDIYDVVEWIIKQPWSNGSVGMIGNSWLAVAQINVAARCYHPAIKCIAPWEGRTNIYRQVLCRGGPQFTSFHRKFSSPAYDCIAYRYDLKDFMQSGFIGTGKGIDLPTMVGLSCSPFHR